MKSGVHVGGIHLEGTVSQICCLWFSFYLMKSRNLSCKK